MLHITHGLGVRQGFTSLAPVLKRSFTSFASSFASWTHPRAAGPKQQPPEEPLAAAEESAGPTQPDDAEPDVTLDEYSMAEEPGEEGAEGGKTDTRFDALEEQLKQEKDRLDELKDKLLRSLAEMENVRRIAKKDVENTRQYAIVGFARGLLDVADNLGRALESVPVEHDSVTHALVEGVQITERVLLNVFERHGVKPFSALGEVLNPNMHQALFEVDDPSKEPGTIAVVTKKGYTIHDRLLRPAEVGVVRARTEVRETKQEEKEEANSH